MAVGLGVAVGRGVGLGEGVAVGGLGVAVAVGGVVGATVGTSVTGTVVGTSVGSGSDDRHAMATTANPATAQIANAAGSNALLEPNGRRRLRCIDCFELRSGNASVRGLRTCRAATTAINYAKCEVQNSIVWCAFSR